MRRVLALLSAVLAAGVLVGLSLGATPAWDISGTWVGFAGDLKLVQTDGRLTGTFTMKSGCTQTYAATGTISGSSVSLTLSGTEQANVCPSTQTLSGTVDPSGTALVLALSNPFQTSPPGRFNGQARRLGAETGPKTSRFSVFVKCAGRHQLCAQSYTVAIDVKKGPLVAQFTPKGHCSDVRFSFSVDGGPAKVSPFMRLNAGTPSYSFPVSPGRRLLKVRAEGRLGGCNREGYLASWGGTLTVRTGG